MKTLNRFRPHISFLTKQNKIFTQCLLVIWGVSLHVFGNINATLSLVKKMSHRLRVYQWDILLENESRYYNTNCNWFVKGVSLLAKTSGETVASPGRQRPVALSPHGHFLLLPSDNNSLLLKSISVSELMLPSDVQSPLEGPSDSALSVVASCLDQVNSTEPFTPQEQRTV